MAAGATYEPIATQTLASAAALITFSSIPATYTDLRLVFVNTGSGGIQYIYFNNDTTAVYSNTWLIGDGTSASSGSSSAYPRLDLNSQNTAGSTPQMHTVDIFSYTGSTNKTCLMTTSADFNGSGQTYNQVGLWRKTAALNRIDITLSSSNTYSIGTTATLYGIKAA
jgi:hypothetical protein